MGISTGLEPIIEPPETLPPFGAPELKQTYIAGAKGRLFAVRPWLEAGCLRTVTALNESPFAVAHRGIGPGPTDCVDARNSEDNGGGMTPEGSVAVKRVIGANVKIRVKADGTVAGFFDAAQECAAQA